MSDLEADYEANRQLLRTLPEPYEILYPVQVRKNEQLDLDTRDYKSRHDVSNIHLMWAARDCVHVRLGFCEGGAPFV